MREALHAAVRTGEVEAVRRVLEADSTEINALDEKHGQSPLHWAVIGGYEDIVRALLDAGADPNTSGRDGVPPLWNADDFGLTNIAELLRSRGAATRW